MVILLSGLCGEFVRYFVLKLAAGPATAKSHDLKM